MIGGGLALIGVIIIAVVVGVVVSKNNSKNKTLATSGSSSSGGSSSNSSVTQTNPNDPSTFVKNPKLHQSFWGMAYTPAGSQLPDCGNSLCAFSSCDLWFLSGK